MTARPLTEAAKQAILARSGPLYDAIVAVVARDNPWLDETDRLDAIYSLAGPHHAEEVFSLDERIKHLPAYVKVEGNSVNILDIDPFRYIVRIGAVRSWIVAVRESIGTIDDFRLLREQHSAEGGDVADFDHYVLERSKAAIARSIAASIEAANESGVELEEEEEKSSGPTYHQSDTATDARSAEVPRVMSLAEWVHVANCKSPKLPWGLAASAAGAGIMLLVSPISNSWQVVSSASALVISPAVYLVGWLAATSIFAVSCESFRRLHATIPLRLILPLELAAVVGLGLLGTGWWWLFSVIVALLGHRHGARRAWWAAVVALAFVFRGDTIGGNPLAASDDEALAMASDSINTAIGRKT